MLNPSFEDTASMGVGYPYLITENWWCPNESTADYFTPFDDLLLSGSGSILHTPMSQYLGYQMAQDGQAYLGLVIYESTGETKEYGQGFLSEPLEAGVSYCVSTWISLADSSALRSCDFQIAFTNELMYDGNLSGNFNFINYVDLEISDIDTTSWFYFENTYEAVGGELYIYLGSNTPNDELSCVEQYSDALFWNTAYLLVDNVKVVESKQCTDLTIETSQEKLVVYPVPADNLVHIRGLSGDTFGAELLNTTGQLIKEQVINAANTLVDVSGLPAGVYLLRISGPLEITSFKIVIE